MSEWRNGKLGELATGIRGVSYTPEQLKEFKNSDTITLLRSNNIQSGWLQFKNIQIVPKSVVSEAQILRFGDIAVCMSNGSKTLVGKAGPFVNLTNEQFTVGAFCSIFRPACGVDCQFTKYIFQSSAYRAQLDISLAGSAINNLRNSEIELFSIKIPPPEHQKKIAKVLDVLDVTIRQTEAIIEKLKLVKQGLLHDLLTRGIDDNGELRPPQSQAPHLYKDSPLGWIPKEWHCEIVGNVIDGSPKNGIYKPAQEIGSGTLLVGQTAFTREGSVDFSKARRAYISNSEVASFGLCENDLLVSRVFATREGVGQPVIVPVLTEAAVYESNMMRLRPRHGTLEPYLLFHWLKGQVARSWIMARAFASNQASINRETLCSVPVPIPPVEEQLAMCRLIHDHEGRAKNEMFTLKKMRNLKFGLMDDLLTGRVRVTPLLDTADA